MPTFRDLTNQKFNRLTAIKCIRGETGNPSNGWERKRPHWICICECGKEVKVESGNLVSGHTKSCGCLEMEVRQTRNVTHGHTRNRQESDEHRIWTAMLRRCNNPNTQNYKRYGANGIYVCDRWKDFASFFEDMGLRPSANYSIERINNSKGYCPENCKWATKIEQANNKSNNRLVELDGRVQTVAQWAREAGVSYACAWNRQRRGRNILTGTAK